MPFVDDRLQTREQNQERSDCTQGERTVVSIQIIAFSLACSRFAPGSVPSFAALTSFAHPLPRGATDSFQVRGGNPQFIPVGDA